MTFKVVRVKGNNIILASFLTNLSKPTINFFITIIAYVDATNL